MGAVITQKSSRYTGCGELSADSCVERAVLELEGYLQLEEQPAEQPPNKLASCLA